MMPAGFRAPVERLADRAARLAQGHYSPVFSDRHGANAASPRECRPDGLSHTPYQAGSQSFPDALTADRPLYSAQDSQLQSQVAITKYDVAFAKARGGGWDGAIDSRKRSIPIPARI